MNMGSAPESQDCIQVEQLQVFARVGVTENERGAAQRLSISMTIWPKSGFNDVADDIGNTIDYSAVCAVTRDFVEGRSTALIETLANGLADEIFSRFPAREIALEVRKFVVPNTKFVAVSIRRQAKD